MGAWRAIVGEDGAVLEEPRWDDSASPKWPIKVMKGVGRALGVRAWIGYGTSALDAQRRAELVRRTMVQ